ncbi:Flp family type IVb pilin [Chlorobium sp. N1]|uniref:Flp family type IVb pilin n=1 Tax=Chlorobium sp. N1 TaxID=2491138 RepID=UPI001A940362|nr:Flp family type IVb pilin [Chlorobium sp. N1]
MLNNIVAMIMAKVMTVKSQKGVTMIEYALIAALVSVVAITTVGLVGDNVEAVFDKIKTELAAALA